MTPLATSAALPLPAAPAASIRHLPVNLFASVMSLAGLALAWRLGVDAFGLPAGVGEIVGMLSVAVFALLAAAYATKAIRHPEAVAAEFNHPVGGNFFGTVPISLLLLGPVVTPWSPTVGHALWTVGVVAALAVVFSAVSRLLRGGRAPDLALPAWLIAGVGALDIPVTGASMPMPWAGEANVAAAGIGAVLAVLMLAAIFARLVFHAPLPPALRPSQMILVAPFALGFLAYVNLSGGVDRFASLLFYAALFFFAVAAVKVFGDPAPFAPGWWAIGFPVAALANAALRYAAAHPTMPLKSLAAALLAALTVTVGVLAVRTVLFTARGRLLAG
ncbi:MAG: C4-dicarboxylate ABC transporter [Rhizobacter sp.]